MKVELIVDPTRVTAATPATLASRVAPAKKEKKPEVSSQLAGVAEAMQGVEGDGTRGGRRPTRGGRGRGRGGRAKGGERPKKSAADLDAEMEDYSASATSAAAAPTAATAA